MSTSQTEQEREQAQTRKKLLQAEATALLFLLGRRNAATSQGLRVGASLESIAGRVGDSVSSGIVSVRGLSRSVGLGRLSEEVGELAPRIERVALSRELARDLRRAAEYSKSYAQQWLKKANGSGARNTSAAVAAANSGARSALDRTAITESSEAFSSGRTLAAKRLPLGLLKVWDAILDRGTCPICSNADGTIVGIRERFPLGVPGEVHPNCRCSFSVLRTSLDEQGWLIEPSELQPVSAAKTIDIPKNAAFRPAAAGAVRVSTKAAPLTSSEFAKGLDAAFTARAKDGGLAVRDQVRALLSSEKMVSREVGRGLAGASKLDVIQRRVGGYHSLTDGTVGLDQLTVSRAHRAARKLMRAEALANDELDGLQCLIHEEIHGTLISQSAYTPGLGASLEEASTELLAREITRKVAGNAIDNVYLNEIRGLRASVRSATKWDETRATERILEAARKLRGKAGISVTTAEEHADQFAKAIKATPLQRERLLAALKSERWWEPEVAERLEASAAAKATKAVKPRAAKPVAAAKPGKPKVSKPTAKAAAAAEMKATKAAEKAAARLEKARLKAEDSALNKRLKAEFKRSGITITGNAGEAMRDMFGRHATAAELRDMMAIDALGSLGKLQGEIRFDHVFGRINYHVAAGPNTTMSRIITRDARGILSVKHESFFMDARAQGHGIGKQVLRSQVSAYQRLGFDKITLNSAEVGRYYWPKLGFNNTEIMPAMRDRLSRWLQANNLPVRIAEKMQTMRDIAISQVGERKIGKEFLLAKDNPGLWLELKLKDKNAQAILSRELDL
jgi:GNAT superfamily N-acetyltransferase